MEKKDEKTFEDNIAVADALIRIKSIENLLIAKGVFTHEELSKEMDLLAELIAKSVLKKANVVGDIDQIIKDLKKSSAN